MKMLSVKRPLPSYVLSVIVVLLKQPKGGHLWDLVSRATEGDMGLALPQPRLPLALRAPTLKTHH